MVLRPRQPANPSSNPSNNDAQEQAEGSGDHNEPEETTPYGIVSPGAPTTEEPTLQSYPGRLRRDEG
jgi:hypothetical protein